jgi:hypothetical protein
LTKDFGDRVIELYTEIGQQLIILLAPDYLWIAEDDEYEEHLEPNDILARHLKVIYWANYFGPGYLDESGRKSFLEAPVGIAKPIQGGIWYQLHKHFEDVKLETVESIESQVLAHFSHLNLDRVQWKYRSG